MPGNALWGAQTQRTDEALGQVKKASVLANRELEWLSSSHGHPISQACDEVIEGQHDGQFPMDICRAGSGTSAGMNSR